MSCPTVEPSGPVIVVLLKKKCSLQKGVIKGTTPDSEVWGMNDDEIIGTSIVLIPHLF